MAIFIAMTVSIAITTENVCLAFLAVIVGMISMFLIKRNVKAVMVDEMVKTIAGKSALMAYSVSTITLAAISLFLVFSNLSNRGSQFYNLGIILSYIVLLEMGVYSFSFYYYNKKYGRDDE
jgi:uncharacterized membrane protein